MYPATLNNDISQNTVAGNSKQNNVVVSNNITYNNHFYDRHDKLLATTFMLELQEQKVFPMSESLADSLRNFFQSLMQTEGTKATIEEKPTFCKHGDVPMPGLNMFKYEVGTYVARNEERPSVLDQLSEDHFHILNQWMGATNHQVLLVVGGEGNGAWSTNLLLEIVHLKPREQMVPFTAHLCGLNFNAKEGGRQECLVQDLVGQLIETYQDRFDGILQSELMTQEPKARIVEIKQLWDLFIKCVKQTGIKKLLIVLDRIDYILAECDDETFSAFVKSLETTSESLWDSDVLVKVMVTSGHFQVARYFEDVKALRTIELHDPPS